MSSDDVAVNIIDLEGVEGRILIPATSTISQLRTIITVIDSKPFDRCFSVVLSRLRDCLVWGGF